MIIPEAKNIFYEYPETTAHLLNRKLSIDTISVLKYLTQPYRADDNEKMMNRETGGLLYSLDRQWVYTPDNFLENVKLNVSDQAVKFIQQFLDLAKKNAIKVYLFNMPIPDPVYEQRKVAGFYPKYFSIMARLKEEYPQTLFIYKKILSYESSYFSDGSHLNSAGAYCFQGNDYRSILKWVRGGD